MQSIKPVRLARSAHRELDELAQRFATGLHAEFLQDALAAARQAPDDPLASLEMLKAMEGTSYARSRAQAAALADVGRWLSVHLQMRLEQAGQGGDINRLSAILIAELGWLRRLVKAYSKQSTSAAHAKLPAAADNSFGRNLGTLRRNWDRLRTRKTTDAPPPPPPAVEAWEAGFLDFLAARKVWQAARRRLDKGKPLKDKRVPLAVRAPELPPGVTLEASFTLTAGLVDVWRASDAAGGQARDFFVVEWDDDPTPWLATRVAFEP